MGKSILIFFSTFLLIVIGLQSSYAQDSSKNKKKLKSLAIQKSIENKNFIFHANSMSPLKGHFRVLNDEYDLTVNHDSLIVSLPYYGEMHIAPPDPTGNSLDFTSTSFEYTVTVNPKGGWNVLIKPKDQKDTSIFSFTIYDNGTAYLDVSNMYKDPISYQGYIEYKK